MILIECNTCPARTFSMQHSDPHGALKCECPEESSEGRPDGRTLTITVVPGSVQLSAEGR
jgi:hypothetical protein